MGIFLDVTFRKLGCSFQKTSDQNDFKVVGFVYFSVQNSFSVITRKEATKQIRLTGT